jgi:hypothetical protein
MPGSCGQACGRIETRDWLKAAAATTLSALAERVSAATCDHACLSARGTFGCTDHSAGSSSLSASAFAAVSCTLPGL